MSETYEIGERVAIKIPIRGVRGRYGTVDGVQHGDDGPEYLVVTPLGSLWLTAYELNGVRA